MKWIKLFEGYLDEYYTEISLNEFYEMCGFGIDSNRLEDIGLDYFERLKGYKTDMNIRLSMSNRISTLLEKVVRIISIDSTSTKFRSQGDRLREIEKRPYLGYYFEVYGFTDEWFLVYFEDWSRSEKYKTCYKCDQMEGLIRLLKDKNVIE
jgi:hypothetical protein